MVKHFQISTHVTHVLPIVGAGEIEEYTIKFVGGDACPQLKT